MSMNNKTHIKSVSKTPSSPHFSCFVRTATEECSNSENPQVFDKSPSSSPSPGPRQRFISAETESTATSLLTPFPSPTFSNSRSRARRNTICYKKESCLLRDDNKEGTLNVGDIKNNSLNPPKILRRSSAPHLDMREISTLARAGISTTNLLNFITVKNSLEKISWDWEIFNSIHDKIWFFNWIVEIHKYEILLLLGLDHNFVSDFVVFPEES